MYVGQDWCYRHEIEVVGLYLFLQLLCHCLRVFISICTPFPSPDASVSSPKQEEQRQSDDNSQMSRSSLDSRSSNILSNEKESWAVQHRKPTPLLTDMGVRVLFLLRNECSTHSPERAKLFV